MYREREQKRFIYDGRDRIDDDLLGKDSGDAPWRGHDARERDGEGGDDHDELCEERRDEERA